MGNHQLRTVDGLVTEYQEVHIQGARAVSWSRPASGEPLEAFGQTHELFRIEVARRHQNGVHESRLIRITEGLRGKRRRETGLEKMAGQ